MSEIQGHFSSLVSIVSYSHILSMIDIQLVHFNKFLNLVRLRELFASFYVIRVPIQRPFQNISPKNRWG